jgi:hypothetical protein
VSPELALKGGVTVPLNAAPNSRDTSTKLLMRAVPQEHRLSREDVSLGEKHLTGK